MRDGGYTIQTLDHIYIENMCMIECTKKRDRAMKITKEEKQKQTTEIFSSWPSGEIAFNKRFVKIFYRYFLPIKFLIDCTGK